jgi:Histidine kinase-, DNA gyrase B-, and HSP90-like ATPase
MVCEILVDNPGIQEGLRVPVPRSAAITPSAARLTESLRDIGYDFPAAVADIVDNSIMAEASRVDIVIEFDGEASSVVIADDGAGMTANGLIEALRYGSGRGYSARDLGRYGLGLKTASLSQCRSVTVVTRNSTGSGQTAVRTLDLDLIAEWDEWIVVEPVRDAAVESARERLADSCGTVVIWRKLDRVLPEKRPDGGWARRRLETMAAKTAEHLGIVFHRYLEGAEGRDLVVTVNGEKVLPWNPFAPGEPARAELALRHFEVPVDEIAGSVTLRRYILPARDQFSSAEQFDKLSGPLNWNRQQGLYIYRAGRLVQWGGWNGIRGIDEHTKLARAALDFDTDLDSVFNINVAKMRVSIPPQIRQMLERPINELCAHADDRYRKTSRRIGKDQEGGAGEPRGGRADPKSSVSPGGEAGLALRAAAMQAGEYEAFRRIVDVLAEQAPGIAEALGLRRLPGGPDPLRGRPFGVAAREGAVCVERADFT